MFRLPSPSLVVSIIALVIALGGAGYTATGGNFILGRLNNASTQTELRGPVAGKNLQLNNQSTAANATALGLAVATGRPPIITNSKTKVVNLNVDLLDGFSGEEFPRIFAFKRVSASGQLLSTTDNFYLAPAFTSQESGRCFVIASTQVASNAPTGDRGPFYRLAIKRGANPTQNDAQFGHYFPPIWGNGSSLVSPELTRSFAFDVTAGEPIQFGVYLGFPPATWVGASKSVDANIFYYCTTISPLAGAPSLAAASGEADLAGLQQDRQARAH